MTTEKPAADKPAAEKPPAEKAAKAEPRPAAEGADARLARLEARLERVEQTIDRVADVVGGLAETVGELADGIGRLRKRFNLGGPARRPVEVAGDCVRVLVEAVLDAGPDGRPLRLGRGDVRSGKLASWLLDRHPDKVERYPRAAAARA